MSSIQKSCSTCRHAYYEQDRSRHPTIGLLRQHCSNRQYNSPEYTEKMYMEDQKQGCCRFWAPIERKESEDDEEQLLNRGA